MLAAWYERHGPAREVLQVGEMATPEPGPGELRVKVAASVVHVSDLGKRAGSIGSETPFPRVIPHSDGAGIVDAVGPGVPESRVGERVWVLLAQSYRPFGTAAEYTVVPADHAVELPRAIEFEQAGGLGIPGITGHRAIFADDRGNIRDGDEIIYLWAQRLKRDGQLKSNRIVTTVMSHVAFDRCMRERCPW